MLGSTLAPSLAFAENDRVEKIRLEKTEKMEKREVAKPKNTQFCTNLTKLSQKFDTRLGEKEIKFTENKQKEVERVYNKRAENDTKLDDQRATSDQHQVERFAKLMEKTTTGTQKIALNTFQSSVQAAVAARRAAFDLAKLNYRLGVNALATQRTSTLATALTTYKTAVKVANDKAVADCAASVDPKVIKTNLETALKTAEKTFKEARQRVEKKGELIKPLLETRKVAMKKATETFHATIEKAKVELKAALKAAQPTTTTTTTP